MDDKFLFIDRAVLVNVCATGYAVEVLRSLPYHCAITEATAVAPFLLKNPSSNVDEELLNCQEIVSALIEDGMIEVHRLQREVHFKIFTTFAQYFRDVQAELFTLVSIHDALLAVDDLRTRKIVKELVPDLEPHSTLSLLHNWQAQSRLQDQDVQPAFHTMVQRALFIPPEKDPLILWWNKIVPK